MKVLLVVVVSAIAAASTTTNAFQVPVMMSNPRTTLSPVITSLSMSTQPEDCPSSPSTIGNRRQALGSLVGWASSALLIASSSTTTGSAAANALDMDAFVSSQLESDTKNCDPKKDPKCLPKLTEDEALCKYGQSGEARAAACKRYKASGGALPVPGSQGKSLGGAYAM